MTRNREGGAQVELPAAPGDASNAAVEKPYRAADQIVDLLYKSGVRTVFGVIGSSIAPLYDALIDQPEIEVVNCKHETMAVFAAAAYGRATNNVGVVLVTSGPGVTNALTGIASAYCDSLPVLILGGEVARSQYGRGALQEGSQYSLNVLAMVQSITKMALELTNPQSAAAAMRKAIATALSGRRGPVFVSLPMDVSNARVSPPRLGAHVKADFTVDAPLLDEVAHALASANRPLILAGSGCRWGTGPAQLLRLAERGHIPVATTPKAKGVFPESHRLALGVYGLAGHPSSKEYLENGVDVLFAVGSSLGDISTNSWNQILHATKHFLQLDIDGIEIGRNFRADIGLVGPAEAILRQLLERVPQSQKPLLVRGVQRNQDTDPAAHNKLTPQNFLHELQARLPEDTIYTTDIGDHMLFAIHYLEIDRPDCFFYGAGLGSMGSGLGAAMGAKLAMPKRPVVCICGDGTLSMSGGELLTAAQQKLPIIFAVFNDHQYGMVGRGFKTMFGRPLAVSMEPMDVAGLATSLGVQAITITSLQQVKELNLLQLTSLGQPVLLNVEMQEMMVTQVERYESLRKSIHGDFS